MSCSACFSPTPRVDWEQSSGAMSPRARTESYGQELVIDDVQFEDAGTYQCGGINTETTSAVRRSFNVEVQCKYQRPCVLSFSGIFARKSHIFSGFSGGKFAENHYIFLDVETFCAQKPAFLWEHPTILVLFWRENSQKIMKTVCGGPKAHTARCNNGSHIPSEPIFNTNQISGVYHYCFFIERYAQRF